VSGTASLPVRRSRVGVEWRDFVELWLWPALVALLPYRAGIAFARFVARTFSPYDDAAREAVRCWSSVLPDGDPRAFLAAYRFAKLIDHADLYWALTRSDRFLLERFATAPSVLATPPGLVVSLHFGQGLWLMRWLREAGVRPRFVSVPSVRSGADSTMMFLYGRVRIRAVERLAGAPPIFLGGARRAIEDALASRETVYALVDVPVRDAASLPANGRVVDRPVRLPTGVLEAAWAARVPAAMMTSRIRSDGRREVVVDVAGDAEALSLQRLCDALTARLREAPGAWHLWNVWPAFVARG
jgi:hypothetical protein